MRRQKAKNMSDIAPITIPEDARCQEASIFWVKTYIACNQKATTIIYHEKDRRGYYMCDACADHNIWNRGGKLVAKAPDSAVKERR